MTSLEVKFALLWYFRFQRQWLCATECHLWDIIVFTDKYLIEAEVKISKSDLWHGEAKKDKHERYKIRRGEPMPNKFYICVTEGLKEEAEKWVKEVNENYGIIICRSMYNVFILRKAKLLREDGYDITVRDSMLKRLCTENIMMLHKQLKEKVL
jgi:hypothetical protein